MEDTDGRDLLVEVERRRGSPDTECLSQGSEESTCSVDPLPPAYTGYSEGKHELPLNPNHPETTHTFEVRTLYVVVLTFSMLNLDPRHFSTCS